MFQSSVDMDKKVEKEQQVYKRIKLLGTGSYGKAYLVKQIKTDQQYVIKQILMADMSQQEQQNALRQAKILQALSHPNVIRFKEVYRTSKMRLNIVMQYADEGDLATKIKHAKKQNKYFQQSQILDWFTQICLGIKHIHDRKIIHRDLKAQNIFLTSDKIVKIGDFGVSKVLQKTALNARTVVGSPYYLSPQIIENKPYSFQTDIWSLGALLYEMCALSPPFVANNLQFLALKIVKGAYGQIPNHFSYELKSLIKSMLNTDSSKRPNINKVLTSKVISKRISSFLTESKRIDEFSHTVIHNKNIFQTNLAKPVKHEQKTLLPPPNLIDIEKGMENKSQICLSNINFDIESEARSRPFTPLIGQQRKGPNNFFNNNKRPSKKNLPEQIGNDLSNKNLNFNDLIQIKPSALQEKVKLPKVNTNPTIFDRRQSQACIKKNGLELDNGKGLQKQIPTTAFSKKRVQSKEMLSNSPIINGKQQLRKVEKQEQKTDEAVGKWKKLPKNLQQIQLPTPKVENQTKNINKNQTNLTELVKQTKPSEIKQTKQQISKNPSNITKNVNRSESAKRIMNPIKKNSVHTNKKQIATEKKAPNISKKSSRKQSISQTVPVFEIVSEEVKKKAQQQKQKTKKQSTNKSASKIDKDKKKVLPKKPNPLPNNKSQPISKIKKPPTQNKIPKKSSSNKILEKLAQPPRLQFQNHYEEELDSPQKKVQTAFQEEQIVQEQKCNSDRSQSEEEQTEQMYSYEEFQQYEGQGTENQLRPKEEQQNEQQEQQNISDQAQERLSLNLSDSCHPNQSKQNDNYNKMLDEMENIKNMIALANGIIDTLPIFGNDLNQKNLLQLSQPSQQVIREDDSDLDSVLNDQNDIDRINQTQVTQHRNDQQQIEENSSINSNSSGTSNCQTNTNLTLLSNQQHLETLKMNLEELFGEENVIFIHRFLCEIIQKEGLDFSQKDVQKMIMFQRPQINTLLLKKYFRLIVTVVIMQQQQNVVG